MDPELKVECAKIALQVVGTFLAAYVVYRLGLRAYFRQRAFEDFRERYVSQGLEEWAAQLEYAMSVFQHNWSLSLRHLKQYREAEENAKPEEFLAAIAELDYGRMDIGPTSRVQNLLDSDEPWALCQLAFAFTSGACQFVRMDFGVALQQMLAEPGSELKPDFIEGAEKYLLELNDQSDVFYRAASIAHDLANTLSRSKVSIFEMDAFAKRKNVQESVRQLAELRARYEAT